MLALVICLAAASSSSDSVGLTAAVACVPVAVVVCVVDVIWRGPTFGVVIERGPNAAVRDIVEPDSEAVVLRCFFMDGFIEDEAGEGRFDFASRFFDSAKSF